jgi:hypothetical protein
MPIDADSDILSGDTHSCGRQGLFKAQLLTIHLKVAAAICIVPQRRNDSTWQGRGYSRIGVALERIALG